MKPFLKKNRVIVAIILFILFLFLSVRYGVTMLTQSIYNEMVSIQKLYADSDIRKGSVGKIDELRAQIAEIEEQKNLLVVTIPKNEIVRVIETIERVAQETGNTVTIESDEANASISKKQTSSKKSTTKDGKEVYLLRDNLPSDSYVSINIKVVGDYNNILHFMKKIEAMPYVSDILTVTIERKPVENKKRATISQRQGLFESVPQQPGSQNNTNAQSESDEPEFFTQAILGTVIYVSGD